MKCRGDMEAANKESLVCVVRDVSVTTESGVLLDDPSLQGLENTSTVPEESVSEGGGEAVPQTLMQATASQRKHDDTTPQNPVLGADFASAHGTQSLKKNWTFGEAEGSIQPHSSTGGNNVTDVCNLRIPGKDLRINQMQELKSQHKDGFKICGITQLGWDLEMGFLHLENMNKTSERCYSAQCLRDSDMDRRIQDLIIPHGDRPMLSSSGLSCSYLTPTKDEVTQNANGRDTRNDRSCKDMEEAVVLSLHASSTGDFCSTGDHEGRSNRAEHGDEQDLQSHDDATYCPEGDTAGLCATSDNPNKAMDHQRDSPDVHCPNMEISMDSFEQECPICTELYDVGKHKQALLNCNHIICDSCLMSIMTTAGEANIGRAQCPLCRQKTPTHHWEIRRLQEEMLTSNSQQPQQLYIALRSVTTRQGPFEALEAWFERRFRTTRTCGCLFCLQYPKCLILKVGGLRQHCRCCFLLSLLILYFVDILFILIVFLPILVLILLFTLSK